MQSGVSTTLERDSALPMTTAWLAVREHHSCGDMHDMLARHV
jgi:hypothetical protein